MTTLITAAKETSPQQDQVPVKSQKLELQAAGLGRKKVIFGNNDQAIEVSKKLKAAYPKLAVDSKY